MAYGNLLADVVQGSTANTPPVFKDGNSTEIGTLCRAWVNFNGIGTVAIRASFNVSSITDNGTGNYTVNFTNALPDSNFCVLALVGDINNGSRTVQNYARTSSSTSLFFTNGASAGADFDNNSVAIFR